MRRVVFLAVPPVQILDLTGPFEVFARCGAYAVEVVTSEPARDVATTCGLAFAKTKDFRRLRGEVDTLLVPGGAGIERAVHDQEIIAWLRRMARKTRRIGSICTGAFLLGAAGLLDNRRCVTHWRWCRLLSEIFPRATVEQDAIFIKDGKVCSSAGITAGLDLALALVEEDHGRAVANEIAQDLVMFLRRPGGQSQFSALLLAQTKASKPIEELQTWILENLSRELTVEMLAMQAKMSPRTFARVFAREAGITPARFVERLRVDAARRMLEETVLSLKEVAAHCGFGHPDSLRRSFQRVLGVTAGEYALRRRGKTSSRFADENGFRTSSAG